MMLQTFFSRQLDQVHLNSWIAEIKRDIAIIFVDQDTNSTSIESILVQISTMYTW